MQNLKSQKQDKDRKLARRKFKVNSAIKAATPDFRVVVNKTNKYMKAQVLDTEGKVLASITDKNEKGTKVESAQKAGEKLAEMMKKAGASKAAYDRNGHFYHGRVKAMAD